MGHTLKTNINNEVTMSSLKIALLSTTFATAALVGCNKPHTDGEAARQAETWNNHQAAPYGAAPGACEGGGG